MIFNFLLEKKASELFLLSQDRAIAAWDEESKQKKNLGTEGGGRSTTEWLAY